MFDQDFWKQALATVVGGIVLWVLFKKVL